MTESIPRQRGFIIVAVALLLALVAGLALTLSQGSVVASKRLVDTTAANQAYYAAQAGLEHARWLADNASCGPYTDITETALGAAKYSATITPTTGSPVTIAATGDSRGIVRELLLADTTVYQPPAQITVQAPGGTVIDTYIDESNPDWNYGISTSLQVRGGANQQRALLRFDLASVPAAARIISARVELFAGSITSAGPVAVHAVTAGWLEGGHGGEKAVSGVSWKSRDVGQDWDTLGADLLYPPAASATVSNAGNWHTWDITSLARNWQSGQLPNNGIALVATDAGVDLSFISRESSNSLGPRMVITMACECGVGVTSGELVLQPDGTTDTDTQIASNFPTNNYGKNGELSVVWSASQTKHALLRFDVSVLPPGAMLSAATLGLEAINVPVAGEAGTHQVLQPWSETFASWVQATQADPWGTPGGDYDPTASDVQTITTAGRYEFDVTTMASAWRDAAVNHGVLVAPQNPMDMQVSSSDAAIEAQRPWLKLSYSCPCGVDCTPVDADENPGGFCDANFAPTKKKSHFTWDTATIEFAGVDYLPGGLVINGQTIPAEGGWLLSDRKTDRFVVTDRSGATITELPHTMRDSRGVAYISSGAWTSHFAVADKSDNAIFVFDLDGVLQHSFLTDGITTDPYDLSFIGQTESGLYQGDLVISSNKNGTGDTIGALYIVSLDGVLKKTIDVNTQAPRPQGVAHLTGSDRFLVADRDGLTSVIDLSGTVLTQYETTTWGYAELQGLTIDPASCEHIVNDQVAGHVAVLGKGQAISDAARLLMVVGNSGNLTTEEAAKQALFQQWNYTTTLLDDNASAGAYNTALSSHDVAFVSKDTTAFRIGNKLNNAAIGVVSEHHKLIDNLGLAAASEWQASASITVNNNLHYITGVFPTGPLAVAAFDTPLAYFSASPAPGLSGLTRVDAGPALDALDAGSLRFDSLPSAGRRVSLPWADSGFSLESLNSDGRTLLRRSLEWGVQPPALCDADFVANQLTGDEPWVAGSADIAGIDFVPAGVIVNEVTVPAGGGWIYGDRNEDRLFVTDANHNPLTTLPLLAADVQGVAYIDAGMWIHHVAIADQSTARIFFMDSEGDIRWSLSLAAATTDPTGLSLVGSTASAVYDNHLAVIAQKDATGSNSPAVYLLDQSGSLVKTIPIASIAARPVGVEHVAGADKLIVVDEDSAISVIDFDDQLLHQYATSAFGFIKLTDIAVDPATCDHVVADSNLDRIAAFNRVSGGGGNSYSQMSLTLIPQAENAWTSLPASVYGIPANTVAEVALVNEDGGKEHWVGLRTFGSALERRVQLHEAAGGGIDTVTMHVQVDPGGRIEYYASDANKVRLVVLGYWSGATYEERFDTFASPASGTWEARDMGLHGVNAGDVIEVVMASKDPLEGRQAGISSWPPDTGRRVKLHAAIDGGIDAMTLLAQTDSGDNEVGLFAADHNQVDFHLVGFFSTPPGVYQETMANLGSVGSSLQWLDLDTTAPAASIAHVAANNRDSTKEVFLGLREKGSLLHRVLELHETFPGGDDLGTLHVRTDSSGRVEAYDEDMLLNHRFLLLGWWQLP